MVTSTPPASYLAYGVTDLNRQSLWNAMTDEGRAKYSSASTSTTGTSTTGTSAGTSTTGTSSGTTSSTSTKPAKGFTSLSNPNALSTTAFDNRIDSRSSAVLKETRAAFSNLWGGDSLLQAQLTTKTDPDTGVSAPTNGGAIFVTYKLGSVATQTRPYDGKDGELSLADSPRGKNPYGYYSTDPAMADTPFVQQVVGTDGSVKDVTYDPASGQKYSDWLKAAKNRYDQYETLVGDQMNKVMSSFGSIGGQGLLGYDVNNNGYIDDESELFGFDNGLNVDGSSTIRLASGATQEFTFLTGNRLTGDPLDAEQETDRALYRRFMILGSDGNSTSVLQSNTGYNAGLGQYVSAQAMLTFDSGGARMTTVAQSGFQVTA